MSSTTEDTKGIRQPLINGVPVERNDYGRFPHGPTWKKNNPGSRTLCKCGKSFDDDRGFYVHIGRMNKTNERVKQLIVKRENRV